MRPADNFVPYESYDQRRQRMLDEAARFIEWGLQNPERVQRIPRHVVGSPHVGFSVRFQRVFWSVALRGEGPESSG